MRHLALRTWCWETGFKEFKLVFQTFTVTKNGSLLDKRRNDKDKLFSLEVGLVKFFKTNK